LNDSSKKDEIEREKNENKNKNVNEINVMRDTQTRKVFE